MTIYLLSYNNYFNRILKTETKLDDYLQYLEYSFDNTNFVIGDGINTEITAGSLAPYNGTANYCLAVENGEIHSRWFVIEQGRSRAGQYILTLRRDLLADYYNDWYNVPAFIERGYLGIDDPFIFSTEQTDFNQIKKEEVLLKDPTECPWIVGYIVAPKVGESIPKIEYGVNNIKEDYSVTSLDSWDYNQYVSKPFKLATRSKYIYRFGWDDGDQTVYITLDGATKTGMVAEDEDNETNNGYMIEDETLFNPIKNALVSVADWDALGSAAIGQYSISDDNARYLQIKNLNQKVIAVSKTGGSTSYYRINVKEVSNQTKTEPMIPTSRLGVLMKNTLAQAAVKVQAEYDVKNAVGGTPNNDTFQVLFHYKEISITLTDVSPSAGLEFTIPTTRKALRDAPYSMFCMPYSDDFLYRDVDKGTYIDKYSNKQNALSLVAAMSASLGSNLYDIQLLPYCPIATIREFGKECWISGMTANVDYTLIDNAQQILFWADTSMGSFDIAYDYPIYNASDNIDFKVNAETKFVRLCSPNYNGVFEFSPHKNGGIAYFNVDYQYKPYSPYIHINPNFGGLYGQDFNDGRGLILGGDFSLTTLTDAWKQYQIENKNYEAIFQSQIEMMEYQNKLGRAQDIVSAITGTVTGATSGAFTGAMVGGGKGAAIGGLIGGTLSAGAGVADVILNEKLRKKTLDYTETQHELALGNIKALPNTLTKITAINNNNKLWPFLELYEATPEEMAAFRLKLIYDGMTINRIGTIKETLSNKPNSIELGFFKAQIIRPSDVLEDYHLASELAGEINKGVYMK